MQMLDLINQADKTYHEAMQYIKQEGAGFRSKAKASYLQAALNDIEAMINCVLGDQGQFIGLKSFIQVRYHALIEIREILELFKAELNEH